MNLKELSPLLHPVFGVAGALGALWAFVEALNASEANLRRLRWASLAAAAGTLLGGILGGFEYLTAYPHRKALLMVSENWSWTHHVGMETKEHLFFLMMLLAAYLPLATRRLDPARDPGHRRLLLAVSGLILLLGLSLEGFGALIAAAGRAVLSEGVL